MDVLLVDDDHGVLVPPRELAVLFFFMGVYKVPYPPSGLDGEDKIIRSVGELSSWGRRKGNIMAVGKNYVT